MRSEPGPSFNTDASSSSIFALRCNLGALMMIQKDCGAEKKGTSSVSTSVCALNYVRLCQLQIHLKLYTEHRPDPKFEITQ